MTTLAEFMILSGGDNRLPMLEKPLKLYHSSRDLPSDVLFLVNHHRVAKDLWKEFNYIRKLINDMNIYKMKLDQFKVNTKFLISLPPEWINQQTHLAEFPQIESSLAVPVFKQGDDPIDAINKMMSFLSTVITSRFLSINNQLRNSSNTRQQETMYDGRCLKPKRKRDASWFRDKVLLVEAQGSGKVLNEEELAFLADPGVAEGPDTQTVITHNVAFLADDLDAYDSDCDEISIAKAVLMANLSSYGSNVLSEVPHFENTHNV
ncbi:hypothetical protein Tco_0964921 [Tanacetum coccineum]